MMLRYVPFIMRQDQPPRRLRLHEGLRRRHEASSHGPETWGASGLARRRMFFLQSAPSEGKSPRGIGAAP
jgi:hypothetical protein